MSARKTVLNLSAVLSALLAWCLTAGAQEDESHFRAMELDSTIVSWISGRSYHVNPHIRTDELRYLTILHYGFDGKVHHGELICNKAIAEDLLDIFKALYEARYQIRKVRLVDEFGADDNKSMEADNSSCFNFRTIAGSSRLSAHAYGMAIDINPLENPYVRGTRVLPESGRKYADRKADFEHKITEDDLCCRLFKSKGFIWGGNWRSVKDYQHFEKRITNIR